MTYIEGATIDDLFVSVLDALEGGARISPRGKPTLELTGAHLVLRNPKWNVLASPARKLNYPFAVAEWLWIATGRNDVRTIGRFNKQIAGFSDDGRTFAGAYGPRLVQQLPYVIDTLTKDPSSRQAVVSIWTPNPRGTADVPCTTQFQFLRRADGEHQPDALTMITTMRSNDAWLGLPYDIFNFTQLQRQVADALGTGVGSYHHQVGSLHLYETNFDQAAAVLRDGLQASGVAPDVELAVPATVEALLVLLGDAAAGDRPEIRTLLSRVPLNWRPYAEALVSRVAPDVIPSAPFTRLVA